MGTSNIDFDLDEFTTASAEDTDGIKQMRSRLKELGKALRERDTELDTYRSAKRSESLMTLLKSKGVPDAAVGLYPKDAEASEEAVAAWVTQYGAAFGINPDAGQTALPPEQLAAQQAMQAAAGSAPAASAGDAGNLQARIQAAQSREELAAVYAEFGLVQRG